MPSVMAIVSKAVFEREARTADGRRVAVGDRWPADSYHSKHKRLTQLSAAEQAGSLFLVTVRPPDEQLWLVAILEQPSFGGVRWTAPANNTPVVDITSLKGRLAFDTGKGLSAKKGALGMSLQTPRGLTSGDEGLLRADWLLERGDPRGELIMTTVRALSDVGRGTGTLGQRWRAGHAETGVPRSSAKGGTVSSSI